MAYIRIRAHYLETRYVGKGTYSIAIYSVDNSELPEKFQVNGKRVQHISARGESLHTSRKYDCYLEGELTKTQKYEPPLSLEVKAVTVIEPTEREGIEQYLVDILDGCGVKKASKIYKTFGADTLRILEEDSEQLKRVKGISPKKAKQFIESYNYKKQYSELLRLLRPFDISVKTVIRVYHFLQKQKLEPVKEIKKNPFILYEERGFSYQMLDSLSLEFGCNPLEPKRIQSAIYQTLKDACQQGHLYLPQKELIEKATNLLNKNSTVPKQKVIEELWVMAREEKLLGDFGNAYLVHNYVYEQHTAHKIRDYLEIKPNNFKYDKYISLVEKKLGITLSENQRAAVNMGLQNQISILIGGAGTGKTTVLKAILETSYKRGLDPDDVMLAAPTGKAAHRMTEATGHIARTIHSMLGLTPDETNKEEDEQAELDCKLLVVDEFSMADMYVAYRLFKALDPKKTKVIFVGDTGQLPSVGAGNVLRDLIKCEKIPLTELNVIFRQANENYIVRNSNIIRKGIHMKASILYNEDFQLIEEKREMFASEVCKQTYLEAVKKYGIDNVQVLSPLKNNGKCAVRYLNEQIQAAINPPSDGKPELRVGTLTFRKDDRIIQLKNIKKLMWSEERGKNIEVPLSNGDTGYILSISKDEDGDEIIKIDFGYGRVVNMDAEDMRDVDLAYCLTIHKSQGSEYKICIIPLIPSMPESMLYRNLLYTGVTRAKEKIIIVGSNNVLHKCIRNERPVVRYTYLAERIVNAVNESSVA